MKFWSIFKRDPLADLKKNCPGFLEYTPEDKLAMYEVRVFTVGYFCSADRFVRQVWGRKDAYVVACTEALKLDRATRSHPYGIGWSLKEMKS